MFSVVLQELFCVAIALLAYYVVTSIKGTTKEDVHVYEWLFSLINACVNVMILFVIHLICYARADNRCYTTCAIVTPRIMPAPPSRSAPAPDRAGS